MSELNFPTEIIDLPSKGLIYPESSPLSSGQVEIKYMTAKEEDILTNQSYINKGVVLDKLLESLIMAEGVSVKDLLIGDKNALLVAARVLGYGKDYSFTYDGVQETVDLSQLEPKFLHEHLFTSGNNEFDYELPSTGTKITFKLLTGHDEIAIDRELEGLKKINKNHVPELSTRLKYMIVSVDGDSERKTVREFVDTRLLARDSRAFRAYAKSIQPDIDLTFTNDSGEEVAIPVNLNFFWPDVE